jgi:hypothetical protein
MQTTANGSPMPRQGSGSAFHRKPYASSPDAEAGRGVPRTRTAVWRRFSCPTTLLSGYVRVWTVVNRRTTERPLTSFVRADDSDVRAFEAADVILLIRETMEGLVTPLREQLDRERVRADRAESALADALTAERIASGHAAALRAEADARRSQGLLRRLQEALKRP